MSSSDQQKPGKKSGRRKQKRSQKPDQAQSPVPDQPQAAKELIDATIASTETSSAVAAAMAEPPPAAPLPPAPAEPLPAAKAPPVAEVAAPSVAEAAPAQTAPASEAKPAETSPVGLQTIATAYRDYTRKSIQDAQSYVEKLSGVRSLDKAMEVQTEFAKQACETFAADFAKDPRSLRRIFQAGDEAAEIAVRQDAIKGDYESGPAQTGPKNANDHEQGARVHPAQPLFRGRPGAGTTYKLNVAVRG